MNERDVRGKGVIRNGLEQTALGFLLLLLSLCECMCILLCVLPCSCIFALVDCCSFVDPLCVL